MSGTRRKEQVGGDGDKAGLWERYVSSRSVADRDALFSAYVGLVELVATRWAHKLPAGAGVDVDDLAQAGSLGLVRAIEAHGELWPEPFNESGAKSRIRWAIRSELRSVDTESRRTRSRLRARKEAMSVLTARLSRMPSEAEVAKEIQLSVRQTQTYLGEVARGTVRCLDAPGGAGEQSIADLLHDPSLGPEALVEVGERVAAVGQAVKQLKERERLVVLASLVEGRRLADIGAELGLTEARVSQIRTEALGKLRRSLRSLDPAS
ncbi:MAG: sigma-70 family RNA polymerase sigma factor [Acidimicrobiales bacterium]